MKKALIARLGLFVVCTALGSEATRARKSGPSLLLVCGATEVRAFDASRKGSSAVWRWSVLGAEGLPDGWAQRYFLTIDECKPVRNGRYVLITSSGGAVALFERVSGRIVFYAKAANAHSAEMLPHNRLVVALSRNALGDRLQVYDLAHADTVLSEQPLVGGHGVVWDKRRKRLFALGSDELVSYLIDDNGSKTPQLRVDARWSLPGEKDGHDLIAEPNTANLIVTTKDNVWRFDPDRRMFGMFVPLQGQTMIKSVSINPASGRIALVKPDEQWWAFQVHLLAPDGSISLPDLRTYKARWVEAERARR